MISTDLAIAQRIHRGANFEKLTTSKNIRKDTWSSRLNKKSRLLFKVDSSKIPKEITKIEITKLDKKHKY